MPGSIVLAPFSNKNIVDWPAGRYGELIALCLQRFDLAIRVIGTIDQRQMGNALVRPYPSARVENLCGLLPWQRTLRVIAESRVTIGNNSGVPHAAARMGVPTVCIFGGSQIETEWMPRGPKAYMLTRHVVCSPCWNAQCRFGKRCLTEISAATVVEMVTRVLEQTGG